MGPRAEWMRQRKQSREFASKIEITESEGKKRGRRGERKGRKTEKRMNRILGTCGAITTTKIIEYLCH